MKDLVYLINMIGSNKYKIGVTKTGKLINRIKSLQTGSSNELVIVETYKSKYARLIEKSIHRQYKHKNTNGEWFELDLEDILKFKKNCEIIENNIIILNEMDNFYIGKILKKNN